MGYKLTRIQSKALKRKFVRLPWKIYRDYPHWVPPLLILERQRISPKHNPFLKYGKIALFGVLDERGDLAGRIAAILNSEHNRIHKNKEGFFGLFECIEELEVAKLLIDAVYRELRSWGLTDLIGPVNFTTNDESGLLLEGFHEPPSFMTNYCPPYYHGFFEKMGFLKWEDLIAYQWKKGHLFPKRFEAVVERTSRNSNLNIRKFRKESFEEDLSSIQRMYNQSFQEVKGFVPLNKDEANEMGKGFKLFADYDIILMGEYKSEAVGFCLTLPDMNSILPELKGRLLPFGFLKLKRRLRKASRVRLIVLAVLPGFRNLGIVLLLIRQVVKEAMEKGYQTGELSVVMESNVKMKRLIESLGFQQTKTYRIYIQKKLQYENTAHQT